MSEIPALTDDKIREIRNEVKGLPDHEIEKILRSADELKRQGEFVVGRDHIRLSSASREKVRRKDQGIWNPEVSKIRNKKLASCST